MLSGGLLVLSGFVSAMECHGMVSSWAFRCRCFLGGLFVLMGCRGLLGIAVGWRLQAVSMDGVFAAVCLAVPMDGFFATALRPSAVVLN